MNPGAIFGWALAVAGVAVGYAQWGWRGALLAVSAAVFWLLLQFSRALRAMRAAADAPVGHVPSAVMLQSKLSTRLRLIDVIQLTRSLGEKLSDDPETYRWADPGGASVTVTFTGGRCSGWQFARPDEGAAPATGRDALNPPSAATGDGGR